ncbi:MAG TPA: hypothetical protein DCE23_09815 [Firmicutes bacterium]|nr:hypothetical protein [Bacillota bacterium]
MSSIIQDTIQHTGQLIAIHSPKVSASPIPLDSQVQRFIRIDFTIETNSLAISMNRNPATKPPTNKNAISINTNITTPLSFIVDNVLYVKLKS